MKLITELIEFALRRNWLTDEEKRYLEEEGFYKFDWSDQDRRHDPFEIDEEDLLEAQTGPRSHSPSRRGGKGKSTPAKPTLEAKELNRLVQEEWGELTKQVPKLVPLWDSWKAGNLAQVFADGFTLNDVYALLSLEFRDYCRDFSGPAPTAYRQLLRQGGTTMGKYSWVMMSPEMRRIIEFIAFRPQLLEEVKTLYQKDRETFASQSTQNGKLDLPNWEKAVQADTTSMRVWTILNLTFVPVTPERIEVIPTWKTALAFAMQIDLDYVTELLENLEKRNWSSMTVITEHEIENTILKSVVIPEGVTEIGRWAFDGCRSLTSVVIPEGVTVIGVGTFYGCSSLTSVVIPESVTWMGGSAFSGCSALTSVVISKGVTMIGAEAFRDCCSLTSVVIPEGVTEIRYQAFNGCSSLTSVVIPEGVTEIGFGAFKGCSSLTSVVIPESVTEIGRWAFEGCISLTSVVIPEGVTSIGSGAFEGCSSLTSVVIPASVTVIKSEAFANCPKLTIHAPAGSKAEFYAKSEKIPFEAK